MKTTTVFSFLVLLMFSSVTFAQDELQITAKDSIVQSSWIFGVGLNAVDDSGNVFNGIFNVSDEWNIVPFPSRVSIGRYFKSGLGLEAVGTYNQYKEGKIIDAEVISDNISYFGIDGRVTYDINKIIGQTAWFDPYVGIGAGYTDANNKGRGTYNAVVGFRTWFSDRWGLDFNSTGKWAMSQGEGATNHIQHAAGVVYQFGIEKGLSKRGEEKLELLAAIAKEKQRQTDSINEVNRLKDEKLLAERLKKQQEEDALAAAEKAKVDAINKRKTEIKSRIENLGNVYFGLNSSVVTSSSKKVLDSLVQVLEEIPTLTLKITSHTDSRGTSKYNDWLSQRRVDKTKDYLLSKGVSEDKLTTEAYGETQLLNECDDNTYCPEEKHAVNRRSEFVILEF
ncbi:outer membrane protein OmpA-like peptidoglycan-associated protein [Maribacter spongiicola]|uniref:Outer membrane protein OmpA-like peptidoglycan-associated protein n=1 Tax=Maribacter spongiicola TaxID=1206753 RepID=A0A4R7K2T6_9FLAO|nr:OmpA family protein [Maribacter spongiicola]TDT44734.1 outer membrane protein OmpA-like peptidoglycan-associated protein [Maribacter spongiicola]